MQYHFELQSPIDWERDATSVDNKRKKCVVSHVCNFQHRKLLTICSKHFFFFTHHGITNILILYKNIEN